ncbi:MAG: hypothetical protein HDS39_00085 [Bacteroides sp.]|nr:hypothetical protein [Bacteroides sp.]
MTQTVIFVIAMVLLIEPLLATAWPRLKVGFFLSSPHRVVNEYRINSYHNSLVRGFGVYSPLRRRIRTSMLTVGILILIFLAVNNICDLNLIK